VDFYGTREANRLARQSLDSGMPRQVITFNALRKDLACQVLLLRHFSGIAAPAVAGNHADIEWR